jgi:predicted  nucleic acid-binding Zn-ribbon protein
MLSKPAWLRDISYKLEAPNSDAVGLARELQAAARAIQRAYMLSKINPTEDDDAGAGEARHRPIPHEETRVGELEQRLADVEVARDNWHDQHDDVAQQLADIRELWERARKKAMAEVDELRRLVENDESADDLLYQIDKRLLPALPAAVAALDRENSDDE